MHPGLRPTASPTHTCLSRSLRVTPQGGVAKWGGAKLSGSSVRLSVDICGAGVLSRARACSVPSHPPPRGCRWPALQSDLFSPVAAALQSLHMHTGPSPQRLSFTPGTSWVSLQLPGKGAGASLESQTLSESCLCLSLAAGQSLCFPLLQFPHH